MEKTSDIEIKMTPSKLTKLAESWEKAMNGYLNDPNPNVPLKDYFIVSWLSKEVSIIWRPEVQEGKITNL
jgi:hypothetical protein